MPPAPIRSRRTSLLSAGELDRARVLDTLVNNLDGMAYRCCNDASWRMIFVSQGCLMLTGYQPTELVENAAVTWEDITHPEERAHVRAHINAAVLGGQRFSVQYRIVTKSGHMKWVVERGVAVPDEKGEVVIEGFIEDVTNQREMLEALEQAELRYRNIFEHASEGIFQTTPDGRYLAANPALARLYGYASTQALMTNLDDIGRQLYVRPSQRERFRQLMEQQGEVLNFESEIYRQDGTRIWISENAHIVRDAAGATLYYEGTVQDISERRHYQEQLERQANHDMLTGLPNRILLGDRVEQGIARAARLGYYLTVVFIDLDNFKFINDSLGHGAGDKLLMEIADRLRHCVRNSDTVARLGGDEFVLLLNDHFRISTVISHLRRVLNAIAQPVLLSGREFHIGASLGVALYPADGEDSANLLKHADVAMYAAKNRGRNNFQFFTSALNREADERLNLETALRLAIEHDEFEVHYQPKFDHRRRIVGMEALARWFHPEYGAVSPDRFIPIAEETGLILPLTTAILRRAFAAARHWNLQRATPLRMAVNLSPRLFLSGDIVAHVAELLDEAQLPADQVELEITETVFMGDGDRAITTLDRFKDLGVNLAMDDFGTGYSSLSYLRRFPLDIIKIDRSLVTGIEHEEEVAMIARAVISLGQSLRKTVVAEGVENQAQFDFLRYQGCHEFQGYLLSRPLSQEALSRLLEAGNAL
ncbi:bifunctional diguanylate cyclase/phosphodiesterase [Rhodoferax sp.]|uniref:putative bifunctional diguanylate cyclase/phosphodiesterase n=1 Tax=Rhodoferax sp. TaxID=50421 RepID=UPI00272F814C|nr:bifunctional diguanylate cyclase/phosphodiesterase [Rhodoferax sp.]MDP1655381.1 EAL domain-containing protein [Hylemonella sp.]MDP1945466.1 EAL domain-containing protein [Rhodoferax sp.]